MILAQYPPMGWNSWDCYGAAVTEDTVRRNADYMAKYLKEYGWDCRRSQQYAGINGDADVVGLPGIHIECKRVERLNVPEAMRQAVTGSPSCLWAMCKTPSGALLTASCVMHWLIIPIASSSCVVVT